MGSTAQRQLLDALEAQGAGGQSIPLSAFMQQVLSHHEYGYYAQNTAIGAEGDFITAPEISPLFGEITGAFLTYVWALSGKPDAGNALYFEAGPGRGSLLADIMRVFSHHDCALKDSQLTLLETSQKLQTQLRTHLVANIADRDISRQLQVISTPDNLPEMPIFGVANEFFDALPVDQAIWRQPAWRHRLVTVTHGTLSFVDGPALTQAELAQWQISNDQTYMTDGTIAEYCPAADPIIQQIAGRIACYGGACLVIDYGKNDNFSDSLQAVAAHKPVDLFYQPGNADISHWVDFAALRRAAVSAGARFIGPVTQADFLMSIGLRERAENAARLCDADGRRALYAAVDRLVGAHHMGTAFKVGLIVPAGDGVPVGFS